MVDFLEHFKEYLILRSFKVRTDHAALQWLCDNKRNSSLLEHGAGKKHGNADGLSRRPCLEPTIAAVDNRYLIAQQSDREIQSIAQAVSDNVRLDQEMLIGFSRFG